MTNNEMIKKVEEIRELEELLEEVKTTIESAKDLLKAEMLRQGTEEMDLDGRLRRVHRHAVLHSHDHGDVIMGVNPAAGDKAVHARQHGGGTDVAGNQEMQQADALIAVHPKLAQAAVHRADLKALLIVHETVHAGGHDVRNKLAEGVQRAEQTPVFAVAHAASCRCHSGSSGISKSLTI